MGHEHNEATEGLVRVLTKANHDMTVVQHRLDREFQQIYPHNSNPMKLVSRIKKIQQDLSALEDQCRQLLTAKQNLIDKARTALVGNRNLLQRMESSMGISATATDSHDSAFTNFNQIIDEWKVQARSKADDDGINRGGRYQFIAFLNYNFKRLKCEDFMIHAQGALLCRV